MNQKIHAYWKFLFVALFFILDRVLKYLATRSDNILVLRDVFGFEYFENFGIAFGVPVPLWFIIFATPILLIFLLWVIERSKEPKKLYVWFALIFLGSVSNLYDRMVHGFVIDYIRIITAMINIADCMIVLGMINIFFSIHPRRS